MGAENVMRLVQTYLVCILYLRLKESELGHRQNLSCLIKVTTQSETLKVSINII